MVSVAKAKARRKTVLILMPVYKPAILSLWAESVVHAAGYETAFEGPVEKRLGERGMMPKKIDQVDGMGYHIAGLAAAKLLAVRIVMLFEERSQHRRRAFQVL